MIATLVKGDVYRSALHGPVLYEGTCSTNRGGAGFCHKFKTVAGAFLYIELENLHSIIEVKEYEV